MGYTFTIGEAVIDRLGDDAIRIAARHEKHDNAPAFGEPTDFTNSRWPSYTGWSEFCRQAGVTELFYGEGWSHEERRYLDCPDGFHRESPLIASQPGAALLTAADKNYVRAALERYRATHPDVRPGFTEDVAVPVHAATLARLIWLDYWVAWAVDNCANPVMENS